MHRSNILDADKRVISEQEVLFMEPLNKVRDCSQYAVNGSGFIRFWGIFRNCLLEDSQKMLGNDGRPAIDVVVSEFLGD